MMDRLSLTIIPANPDTVIAAKAGIQKDTP